MTLDRATVLDGIATELETFRELVAGLPPGDLDTDTACDGWSVRDVAGHVVGTAVDITQGRIEGQGSAEVTARQARERAGRSAAELAEELAAALPTLNALLASLPEEAWTGPSLANDGYTLGFAVEAMWYDAFVHGNDIRAALGRPLARGAGMRCAVHHLAGYLDHRDWRSVTLALDGIEPIDIAGGGPEVHGDPMDFIAAATGRTDPSVLGLDDSVNVYAEPSA